jgi:hypothetical protein
MFCFFADCGCTFIAGAALNHVVPYNIYWGYVMLPLPQPKDFAPPAPEPSSDIQDSKLFTRLKTIACQAVPEIETKDWVEGFDQKIKPHQIPYFLMRVQGYSIREIAEMTQCSKETVRRALNSPAGQDLLRELYAEAGLAPAEVSKAFQSVAMDAVEIITELAHTADRDETRLKAAFSILDRAGYGVTRKVEKNTTLTVGGLRGDELQSMRQALQESLEMPAEFEVLQSVPTPDPNERTDES